LLVSSSWSWETAETRLPEYAKDYPYGVESVQALFPIDVIENDLVKKVCADTIRRFKDTEVKGRKLVSSEPERFKKAAVRYQEELQGAIVEAGAPDAGIRQSAYGISTGRMPRAAGSRLRVNLGLAPDN
jgi:hypothetical protein